MTQSTSPATVQSAAERNAQAVRDFYDALAQGDLEAAGALLTDDAVLHVPGRSTNTGATYTATRPDRETPLENNLANVMTMRDGRIAESWLHSRDQYAVDAFWGD